jgi:hypothetical protein
MGCTEIYFNDTPVSKSWIDMIDIVIPLFSRHFVDARFQAGNVVYNRKGVSLHFSNELHNGELSYLSSTKTLAFTRRKTKTSQIVVQETRRLQKTFG